MTRYFFHVVDGERIPDDEGTELPNLSAARHASAVILADLLRGSEDRFWHSNQWRIEIADADGTVLAVISVSTKMLV